MIKSANVRHVKWEITPVSLTGISNRNRKQCRIYIYVEYTYLNTYAKHGVYNYDLKLVVN